MYLIYAEANLRGGGGDAGTALGLINDLRERAYGNTSGNISGADLTLDFILDERARELYWEGHRRTDLIRFGKYGDAWWEKEVTDLNCVSLWPIPQGQIDANPNFSISPTANAYFPVFV